MNTPLFILLAAGLSINNLLAGTNGPKEANTILEAVEWKNTAVQEALDEIRAKAHLKVLYTPRKQDEPLTVSLKNIPAIEALRYIANLEGLKITYKDDVVLLTPAAPDELPRGGSDYLIQIPRRANHSAFVGIDCRTQAIAPVDVAWYPDSPEYEKDGNRAYQILSNNHIEAGGVGSASVTINVKASDAAKARTLLAEAIKNEGLRIHLVPESNVQPQPQSPSNKMPHKGILGNRRHAV